MKLQTSLQIIGTVMVLILEVTTFALPLYADTMPTKEGLAAQITADAQTQTSSINADTSSAPQTSTSVTNTGNNTSTSTSTDTNTQTTVDNQNTATVNQTVNATANTGGNEANRNISIGGDAGTITTGDANVNSVSYVQANTNNTALSGGTTGTDGTATSLTNTGNGVSTSTGTNTTKTTLVNNGNTTTISQMTNAYANTGGNTAARNISIGGSSGVITTGNASTNVSSLVTANGSVMLIGGRDNGNGPGSGASIVLANAGDAARFTSLTNNDSFLIVTNNNRATISQTCGAPLGSDQLFLQASLCSVNTGGNDASRNIARGGDAGVIHTGDATLHVSLMTNANRNTTAVSSSGSTGGTSSEILNTGNGTSTATTNNNMNSVGVSNTNSADVNQTINAVANTGNNKANRNISFGGNAGVITTGNATVHTYMGVAANNNDTRVDSPVAQGSSLDPYATILNTGNNPDFTSQSNTNSTTEVSNTNLLGVTQSLISQTNSGLNTILRSVGTYAGVILTGNAYANLTSSVSGNNNDTLVIASETYPTPTSSPGTTSGISSPIDEVAPVSPTPTPQIAIASTGQTNIPPGPYYTYYYYSYNYPTSLGTSPVNSILGIRTRNPFYPYISSGQVNSLGLSRVGIRPGGQVLGSYFQSQLQIPKQKVPWMLMSILSSMVSIGIYVSRNNVIDPRLFE